MLLSNQYITEFETTCKVCTINGTIEEFNYTIKPWFRNILSNTDNTLPDLKDICNIALLQIDETISKHFPSKIAFVIKDKYIFKLITHPISTRAIKYEVKTAYYMSAYALEKVYIIPDKTLNKMYTLSQDINSLITYEFIINLIEQNKLQLVYEINKEIDWYNKRLACINVANMRKRQSDKESKLEQTIKSISESIEEIYIDDCLSTEIVRLEKSMGTELMEKLEQYLMFLKYHKYSLLGIKINAFDFNINATVKKYDTLILHINQYIYEFASKKVENYTIIYYLSNIYRLTEPSTISEKITAEQLRELDEAGKIKTIRFKLWK
jgi:hypothetical protein